jgi:hypothetical protein
VVNQARTSTTLTSSANPSRYGQTVTLTARVTSAAGPVTGMVTFYDGSNPLNTVPLSGGVATLSTSSLGAGSHSITAVYAGNANLATSQAMLTQTVRIHISKLKVSFTPAVQSGVHFTMTVQGLDATGAVITALAGQTATLSVATPNVQLTGPLTATFDSTGTLVFSGLTLIGKGKVSLTLLITNVDATQTITVSL